MNAPTNGKAQAELFQAETAWFHVFKTMIDSGDLAQIGPLAFTVYCVIKSHTNFSTGRAFPALETIAEKSGISLAQVKRELKVLETGGYLTKEKKGRSNTYTLREKVGITDEQGRPAGVATWDYLPSSVQAAVADLRRVLVEGDWSGARIVNIERLTVNINTGSGPQVNFANAPAKFDLDSFDLDSITDKKLRDQLEKLIHSSLRHRSD